MADLQITREFKTTPERLFEAVTQQSDVLNWWGYDGMELPSRALDFSRKGPWHSVMVAADGTRYSMSGQVTKVTPPYTVSFTWAWHDDADKRGDDSHVMISLSDNGDGTTAFTLHHMQLATEELAANHNQGWTSSVAKLEALANSN